MDKIKITVDAAEDKEPIGALYGIFFEDINHAADGGLYVEMVQNRAFEFSPIDNKGYRPLTAWEKIEKDGNADWFITTQESVSKDNPNHLVLSVTAEGGKVGIRNHGYQDGMFFEALEEYRFSCYAKTSPARQSQWIQVLLTNSEDEVIGEAVFEVQGDWKKYELKLAANKTELCGKLDLLLKSKGRVELDFISLMPVNTFKNRRNGMRRDLSEVIKNLKPSFMRFPGGCLVHDGAIDQESRDSMYRWKKTIGNLIHRPARRNNWNYNQSLGIGYYEYFLFCEDIGTEPLPVLPAGYNPHSGQAVPVEELESWIQDALDLIEFANGDKNSKWGNIRTTLGHSEPFHLKYIAIGNEEVGDAFWKRYALFHSRIKDKYPDIMIINSAGPFCDGEAYEKGWESANINHSDFIDEHYYQSPEWFIANHHRYDDYNEKTKVFLGEYASCGNKWWNALAEASYMIGLENNARSVGLACYAPLLCNSSYVDWNPNLIWFNNHAVYGTPNYYVQKLFMNNKGKYLLGSKDEGIVKDISMEKSPNRFYGKIVLSGYRGRTKLTKILVDNMDTGERKTIQNAVVGENEEFELGCFRWKNFKLKWRALQVETEGAFECILGCQDDKNYFAVDFGGWEKRDLFISDMRCGVKSFLNQKSFHMVQGKTYDFQITVKNNNIQIDMDNITLMVYEHKTWTMESLYYTASRDDEGNVIVKLVNVTGQEREIEICLNELLSGKDKNTQWEGDLYYMEGFEEDDSNSFEEPEKVVPSHKRISIVNGNITFFMPGKALRIYRFKKNGSC